MDEGFRRKVKDFLNGTLDKKGTLEVLDQVKRSEVCRHYLEEQARAAASARRVAGNETAASAHGCETVLPPLDPGSDLRHSQETDWGSLLDGRKRRGLRRTILLGLAVLLFMAVGGKLLKKEESGPGAAEKARIEELTAGSPVMVEPASGRLDARPIAISALLPAGNEQVKLLVFTGERVVHEREFKAGDSGVDMAPITLNGPSGKIQAVEALLPFPASERLALVTGERYFLTLELPNGRQSTPTSLLYQKD
ncbi:MAG: hypothetical protein H6807_07510 [Planctomycetes bacterium]|nr:hypothetical protein [Planctomycetota bacterium]